MHSSCAHLVLNVQIIYHLFCYRYETAKQVDDMPYTNQEKAVFMFSGVVTLVFIFAGVEYILGL